MQADGTRPTRPTKVRRAKVVNGPNGETLKVCTACQAALPPDAFTLNSWGTLGRSSLCRTCESARRRARYQANLKHRRERNRENARRRYAADPQAHRDAVLKWRTANPEKTKAAQRRSNLKRLYGLTVEQYEALLAEQDGGCAVCRTTAPPGRGNVFHVDHDHSGGKGYRGLLCGPCNTALGLLGDDPDTIAALLAYRLSFLSTQDVRKQHEDG